MSVPTPLPLNDPRLRSVENPEFVAGIIQINVDRRPWPESNSFDFGGDPRWLAGHQLLLPYETLPDGQLQPATALHFMAVFTDLEALWAWTLVLPGMTPPDAILGPMVTHAAIVDVADLQDRAHSSGVIDRIFVNPLGPAAADVKLPLLAERTSSLDTPGNETSKKRHLSKPRPVPGEGPVEISQRFLGDPLVHPSSRSGFREEVRSSYAKAEEVGLGGDPHKAAELYWSAGRSAQRASSPQLTGIAALGAARWLEAAGKTELAADKAKIAWVGLHYCVNQTWMHETLMALATLALKLGRNQSIFTRHDYMNYVAPLHALAEVAKRRSSDPRATELAKKADELVLRVSYELISSTGKKPGVPNEGEPAASV